MITKSQIAQWRAAIEKAPALPWKAANCRKYDHPTRGPMACYHMRDANGEHVERVGFPFMEAASVALPLALDEIDRLAKVALDYAHEVNEMYERGCREGAAAVRASNKEKIEEQGREIERLRAALEKAADDLENAVSYVPEYFQDKWDMADDVKAARAALRKP